MRKTVKEEEINNRSEIEDERSRGIYFSCTSLMYETSIIQQLYKHYINKFLTCIFYFQFYLQCTVSAKSIKALVPKKHDTK